MEGYFSCHDGSPPIAEWCAQEGRLVLKRLARIINGGCTIPATKTTTGGRSSQRRSQDTHGRYYKYDQSVNHRNRFLPLYQALRDHHYRHCRYKDLLFHPSPSRGRRSSCLDRPC
jgi:hypothetical protein